jgi:hypothetical protein
MADGKKDNNGVEAMLGVLNTDGVTPTLIKADPTTHILAVSDGTTGSDFGNDWADRDNNTITTLIATDADGNIINLYANSSNELLIQTT